MKSIACPLKILKETMKSFACFCKKFYHLSTTSYGNLLPVFKKAFGRLMACIYRFSAISLNPFWVQLCYCIFLSFLGSFALKVLKPKTDSSKLTNLDLFFMSVSSVTASSMSTVEMEEFSNSQLVFMTVLMLLGGEVFISMLWLQLQKAKFRKFYKKVDITRANHSPKNAEVQMELGLVPVTSEDTASRPSENIFMLLGEDVFISMFVLRFRKSKFRMFVMGSNLSPTTSPPLTDIESTGIRPSERTDEMGGEDHLEYKSLRYLGFIVLAYLLVAVVGGYILVILYISVSPNAGDLLRSKGIQLHTFSVFAAVSTFANCGFLPTNENMIIFKNYPGLLLILIPQILLGNTLYPPALRAVIWVLGRLTGKEEFKFMLKYREKFGYHHLIHSRHSLHLVLTVFGLILVQLLLFCSMEWNSGALDGMSSYQKIIGALFQSVNTRHAGESIVDLSSISPALLVLFGLIMYLPPYTSFLPVNDDELRDTSCNDRKKGRGEGDIVNNLLFSQLSYLVIFVILICITERKRIKDDPLNFTLANIAIEVVSAYGNVGFTTGYSCKRQINPNSQCKDTWYGFSGRWSNEGKIILIVVMIFGKLKKFSLGKGKAWKLY